MGVSPTPGLTIPPSERCRHIRATTRETQRLAGGRLLRLPTAQAARFRRARVLGLWLGARGGHEDGGGQRARGDVPGAMLEGWW